MFYSILMTQSDYVRVAISLYDYLHLSLCLGQKVAECYRSIQRVRHNDLDQECYGIIQYIL